MAIKIKLLIIDDDIKVLNDLSTILSGSDFRSEYLDNDATLSVEIIYIQANTIDELIKKLIEKINEADIVLLDKNLIDNQKKQEKIWDTVVKYVNYQNSSLIVYTGYPNIADYIKLFKKGVTSIAEKRSYDEYYDTKIHVASEIYRLLREKEDDRRIYDSGEFDILGDMIIASPNMKKIKDLIIRIKDSDISVLITGETGTGKELVTRAIHELSDRKDKPFIKINCATLPQNLLESELFGYERGAFTGAQKIKPGRFEFADTGTIFLDEIGEVPPSLQAKLLQVLQEQQFNRLGGKTSIKVDVRIISATNRDLEKEIRNGKFRNDLFYRLNVMPIKIPPLRERKIEIIHLTNYFITKYQKINNGFIIDINTQNYLEKYNWPGNIRELESLVNRCVVIAKNKTEFNQTLRSYLEERIDFVEHNVSPYKERKNNAQKELINISLVNADFNVTKAAELAGISRAHFHKKLKDYGINPEKLKYNGDY